MPVLHTIVARLIPLRINGPVRRDRTLTMISYSVVKRKEESPTRILRFRHLVHAMRARPGRLICSVGPVGKGGVEARRDMYKG